MQRQEQADHTNMKIYNAKTGWVYTESVKPRWNGKSPTKNINIPPRRSIPKDLIYNLISLADYDVAKGYNKSLAEDPEMVEDAWSDIERLLNQYGFTLSE